MKPGIVDPIIGLDVPSGNVPIKSEMVEMTPISNTNPQVSHHSVCSKGTSSRSHEWDKHIADKKFLMALILSRCDETAREEITLGQSPGYDVMTGGLLKSIKQLHRMCIPFKDKNIYFGLTISMITEQHVWSPPKSKNVFFESNISKFTEIYIRPTNPNNNCMRKNIDSCNISLDNTSEPEEPVNTTMTTTSIRSEDNSNTTQESIGSTVISMSEEYNKTWYDTNEEYDSWNDAIETMDNYQEWVDPPTADKSGCEFLISILCKFCCFMLLCTFQVKATACGTFVCAIRTLSKAVISTPIAIYK